MECLRTSQECYPSLLRRSRPEVGEERGALFAVHPGRKLLEVILVAQVLILVSI